MEVIHGVEVHDPYRWLEDGSSAETAAWTRDQNERTRSVLDALGHRAHLHRRLSALLRAGSSGSARIEARTIFSLDRWGEREQAVLCTRPLGAGSAGAKVRPRPTVVLDPVELLGDDTGALDWFHPSRDASLVAYGVSTSGDERSTLRILDVSSGEQLPDEIPHTRAASVGWWPDASGFHYTRYASGGDYDRHVFAHRLGTPWAQDEVVFADLPDPTAWPDVAVSRDGRWALVHVSLGWSRNDVHLIDLRSSERITLIEGHDALSALGFDLRRGRLVGHTNLEAPRGRVIEAPLGTGTWTTLIEESDAVVEAVVPTSSALLVAASRRAVSNLGRYLPDGSPLGSIELPDLASLVGLSAAEDQDVAVVALTSFTRPSTLFLSRGGGPLEQWSDLPGGPDTEGFSLEQVQYPSTDGTPISMFLLRPAGGADSGGPLPTVLNGYGGFAVTNSPAYSAAAAAWVESGGCWAVACIRGGAEEGEAWHQAGMRERKQQVFDDFCAAADWLVEQGLASRERLAIRGGSNGGLLVGAAVTQRPELCRAAVCAVPLLDMVRYHRFLIAKLWIPEYGDPDVAQDFAWLYAYSPYHHVLDGRCYPSMLIEAAEQDSRVHPMHARKFGARLQAATSCAESRPILVRIESRAGHGQGKPAARQADEAADVLAFLRWQLDC